MCAINGFNGSDKERILKMNKVTAHRGPDDSGVFVNKSVSFGHNRLSIIDLSKAGHQPMQSENGRYTIVFNGEIYNFRELKKEFQGTYPFRSGSDTEVILALFEKYGYETPEKLNGIFAFAIWDDQKQEVFLARDHIGVKPLYYYFDGTRFIFSSEIKALLEHDIPRILNTEAFEHYMRIQYIPEPLTIFKGISKLPPAHYAVFREKKLKLTKYWNVSPQEGRESLHTYEDQVRESIRGAVERQLISDRPLGIFLSGGIDSSVVLDSVAKIRDNISTYSIGFKEKNIGEFQKFNADFELAKKTAQFYGTKHHELLISGDDIIRDLEKIAWHLDEPNASVTSISQYKLSAFAKESVAVALGGDGGDELFGGYERYRLAKAARIYQQLVPSFLRSTVSSIETLKKLNIEPGIEQFVHFMFQKDGVMKQVLSPTYVTDRTKHFFDEKYFKENLAQAEAQLMDTDRRSWLVDECLFRTDKLSMASGLELRVPILDKEVVELAYTIPTRFKVGLFDTKKIIKDAFRGSLPGHLYGQPKRGWFSPAAKWLRDEKVEQFVRSVLHPEYYKETSDLFDFKALDDMYEKHKNKVQYNRTMLWVVFMFQLWARQYRIEID